jgi:hypothetical protein
MPTLDTPQVDVTIKGASGRPASIELKGVTSIMEIPNEVEGHIKGISFYGADNHWVDFELDEFETIIIRKHKAPAGPHIAKGVK